VLAAAFACCVCFRLLKQQSASQPHLPSSCSFR
jgi:hypothetical protein